MKVISEKQKKKEPWITGTHYYYGCRFDIFVRLIWRNRKDITPKKIPQIIVMAFISFLLWPFALIEELFCYIFIYSRKQTAEPIFILGHWRSGTTYLHYLLACDPAFAYLSPVETYAYNNFLILGPILRLFMKDNMKKARPMDNVEYFGDSPSEETYALTGRTTYSLMHMLSFPKNFDLYRSYGFTGDMKKREKATVKRLYKNLVKKVQLYKGRRQLILKSPENTCRAAWLADVFPEGKFIHIYRNPYNVIRSTINMLEMVQDFIPLEESPRHEEMEDLLLALYRDMYIQYFKDKEKIPAENLIEICYEDFEKEPLVYLERIYKQFGLDRYDKVKPHFEQYIEEHKDYKKNKFTMDASLIEKINKQAGFVFEHYGYEMENV